MKVMDNIGDWLYIVLLVAAGISGLLNSGKKKQAKKADSQPPPKEVYPETETTPVKGFWELFEEELKPKETVVLKKAKLTKEKKNQKTRSSFLDVENSLLSATANNYANILSESEEDECEPLVQADNFHHIKELRKAIVYSEILNRKY